MITFITRIAGVDSYKRLDISLNGILYVSNWVFIFSEKTDGSYVRIKSTAEGVFDLTVKITDIEVLEFPNPTTTGDLILLIGEYSNI